MRLRHLLLLLSAATICAQAAAADVQPAATAQSLCDALTASMKRGASLDFAGRKQLLAPEVERDFDLPLMTRIVVGPSWRTLSAADHEALVAAFSDDSVATYAHQFKSFGGERFVVDPAATTTPSGDAVVHTKLFTGSGDPVELDYLERRTGDSWKIIDIFLSGTISELAARRSEYSAVLRLGGPKALVDLLRKKAVELGT